MLNLNKCTKTKPKPTFIFKNCSYVCISLCTTVVHNTAQNSSDNLPSYPPDNHHSLDDIYWSGGGCPTACSLVTGIAPMTFLPSQVSWMNTGWGFVTNPRDCCQESDPVTEKYFTNHTSSSAGNGPPKVTWTLATKMVGGWVFNHGRSNKDIDDVDCNIY